MSYNNNSDYQRKDDYPVIHKQDKFLLIERIAAGCFKIHDPILTIIFVFLYLMIGFILWPYTDSVSQWAHGVDLASPAGLLFFDHILQIYLIVAGVYVLYLSFTPRGTGRLEEGFIRIGLKNHLSETPVLLGKKKNKKYKNITEWHFHSPGIPKSVWEEKSDYIESIMNIIITDIRHGRGKQEIVIESTSGKTTLPSKIEWNNDYIDYYNEFSFAVGQSYTGTVYLDIKRIPHILLGGSTGSGKSVLLKNLIYQAYYKNAEVYVADFKGGVDYSKDWKSKLNFVTDEASLLNILTELVDELESRKKLFADNECENIDIYNRVKGESLHRYILAFDEVAEVLDKTGTTKEQKAIIDQVESKISIIARQGRAFGIHMILATQRPDSNILSGQIKNNIDYRICGRADKVLSQIILDNSDAADKIPKRTSGRFLLNDGTEFQAFYISDKTKLIRGDI